MAATKTFQEIIRFFEDANKSRVKAKLIPYHCEEVFNDRNRIHGEVKAAHPWILRLEKVPGSLEFIGTLPELRQLIGELRSLPQFTILNPNDGVYTIIYEIGGEN